MSIAIINPYNLSPLHSEKDRLVDSEGNGFPIRSGVARIAEADNYTNNFGLQWNKFDKTQLDRDTDGLTLSRDRFFAETGWNSVDLTDKTILEVGSGAGRFSKVVLEHTQAQLYSVDYSDAVSANMKNNGKIAPNRFHLFQASIYEMPFLDNVFDKVFCFGVLQHTPDFYASVKALINKAKPGGEIVVDFYPINGYWTKLHAKYMLRPLTKRMSHERLFDVVESNVNWLIVLSRFFRAVGVGVLTRFIPIVDLSTMPSGGLTKAQFREWAVLDTFDMFSPSHDNPQRIKDVVCMFRKNGVYVTFSGFVEYAKGHKAAVVRGIKQS